MHLIARLDRMARQHVDLAGEVAAYDLDCHTVPRQLDRRAVVAEPEERREAKLMQQLSTMHKERQRKRKLAATQRREKHAAAQARENADKELASKKLRKKRYVAEGLEEKRRARGARGGGGGDD